MNDALLDLIIIGAGIHGAGVAQAAAARGCSCLVLEQYDRPACGTSGRSSKLIHGGLRYLESGRLSLVKECLRERTLLLRNAPQLVKPVPFYIPVYKETTRSPATIRVGLSLYALLTGLRKEAFFKKLSKAEQQNLDGIKTSGLKAVYQYWDAQTDDAALTGAVLKSAIELGGCEVQYNARVTGIELQPGEARVVYFSETGGQFSGRARVVVNAAGPWAHLTAAKTSPPLPHRHGVDLVQGAHIILPHKVEKGIYYLESPRDKRAVFAMPWRGATMVGTTETDYSGDPAKTQPLETEVEYLLETFNHYFKKNNPLGVEQIISSFAGLRVLPKGDGKPFSRSRETILIPDREQSPRILSIYGGKLTTYRATSEKVMNLIASSLPVPRKNIDTKTLPLKPESRK